jgi:SAM-dependent methyltransferase
MADDGGAGARDDAGGRAPKATEAEHYRKLERQWQDDVGCALLDKPYEAEGSAAVFDRQSDRLIALLDPKRVGVVIEIGCGKGHLLRRLRDRIGRANGLIVGIDISRAVHSLPGQGLAGVQADGECLPFRDGCATYVIYDGALHHLIDYSGALCEAERVLAPGGSLLIFEPVTSLFSRLVHRLLDPIVFRRSVVYESPIDIHYKSSFRQDVIRLTLVGCKLRIEERRSDFLAYPFTGCYASSAFARRKWFMRLLISIERCVESIPLLRSVANLFAWRFIIVATKEA